MQKEKQKNTEQFNSLQEFEFQETPVFAGFFRIGEMIALKPIVENLGMAWSWQFEQIQNNEKYVQLFGKIKVVAKDGKAREMVCLPPQAIQDWLWSIKPTENTNSELLEEYKKGLVIHLMTMLKISLDEIDRLRVIESKYNRLAHEVTQLISTDDEGKQFSRQAKERFKYAKELKDSITRTMNGDDGQLMLPL